VASERLAPGLTAEITAVVDDKLVVKHGRRRRAVGTIDDRLNGTRGYQPCSPISPRGIRRLASRSTSNTSAPPQGPEVT
jgi:hypothetical protein